MITKSHKKADEYLLSDMLRIYKLPIIAVSLGLIVAILVFLLLVGNNFNNLKKSFIFTSALEAGIIQSRFNDVINKVVDKTIATNLHVIARSNPSKPLEEALAISEVKAVYLVTLDKERKIDKYQYKSADDDEVGRITEGILTNDYMKAKLKDLVIVPDKTSQTVLNTSAVVNGKEENFLIMFFGFMHNKKPYALMYFVDPKQVIRNAIYNETNKTSSRRSIYIIKKYEDQSFGVITEYYRTAKGEEEVDAAKNFLVQKQIGDATFHHSLDIELLGEKFGIVHIPTNQYLSTAANIGVWIVFFAILIITMLAGYLFFYLVTFNVRSSKLVDLKTGQLVMAKEELESKNDELKEINTELEDFTYIVSHDIRSPLVNILGFSDEIKLSASNLEKILESEKLPAATKEKIKKILQAEIVESLAFIDKSVRNLDHLTSTILDYLRTDKGLINIERIDTEKVVQDVIARYQHQIKSRNIDIQVGHLPDVRADLISIQEVFSNIIDNAIKYMKPNKPGMIKIRAKYVPAKAYTMFCIWDNGQGIGKEVSGKVFQIMRRATLDKSIPGHGMGMPFVKSILKKHKGKIWFKSIPGKGTVFYFYIPDGN